MRASAAPLTLVLFAATACAGAPDDASVAESSEIEPRVAYAPTAAGQMPPAILGDGGDLEGVSVHYVEGDEATMGYLSVPEGEGPFPALVIIHEWNGLVDRVRQVADDFAAEGYITLAADLYSGRTGSSADENIALMTEANADMPGVVANLNAAVAYLRERSDITGRVGTMGWCFGGGIALSYGLDGDDHDATAIFYGRLVEDPAVLATMDHEVYGTFASLDNSPAPENVAAFETALRSAGIENDLHIYDGVGHGFWLRIDGETEASSEAGLDAWERLKAYLERTLRS